MKRISTITTSIFSIAFLTMFSLTFVSCDDEHWYDDDPWYNTYGDDGWYNQSYNSPSNDRIDMANLLRGHWQGQTESRFYDSNNILKDEIYTTDIEFDQYMANSVYGRGIQKDYIGNTLQYSRTFSWGIDEYGNVNITYDGNNGGFTMVIAYNNLKLDSNAFTGTMTANGETDVFSWTRYTYAKPATRVAEVATHNTAKRQ